MFVMLIAGIGTFALAAFLFRPVGHGLKTRAPLWTWLVGVAIAVAAMALLAVGSIRQIDWLWGVGLGLGFGGLSGLRYGSGTLLALLHRTSPGKSGEGQ